ISSSSENIVRYRCRGSQSIRTLPISNTTILARCAGIDQSEMFRAEKLCSLSARTASQNLFPTASHLAARQERQPLEQVHVLLVLEQRAVQRRDQLARIALAQHFRRHVLVEEELQPVEQLRGRGLLLQAGHFAHLEEDAQGFLDQPLLDAREVD